MVESSHTLDPAEVREEWASTVVLGDGETVRVRPIRPEDAPALAAFHRRQSANSNYRRYFSPKPDLTARDLAHFTNVDMVGRAALVVERRDELIAWASYEQWAGRDDADAAFQVDDEHHGKGIATLLLEHLATIARAHRIVRFTAEVLADNRPMLAVFSRAGWPVQRRFESGVVDLDFSLEETTEFLDSVERREQRGDSRAMARLLLPRSIAVVGASDRPGSIGAALWRNVTGGATGPVYPVNPSHRTIDGHQAWPSIAAVPGDVSLAVIAVPAAALATVVDDCIAARVRGAVILTSIEGTDVDIPDLVSRARRHGVRLIGPGSMGIAASRPSIGLNAALVPVRLPPGPVAISLQSGSLGASVLRLAERLGMGLSWFVSLGAKGDVSGNDLLQFWEDDETTRVIAMYTESFGNPRKFARIARRVSRRRPIVAVRTGAAAIGPSGSALYQQAGLIEVPTVASMLDTARVLATQPVMRGPRVAVVSNAASPTTLAVAAVAAAGLQLVATPHSLDWRSTTTAYGVALRAALAADDVDAVLVVHAPPLHDLVAAPVQEIDAAAAGATKPVVAVLLGAEDGPLQPGSDVPTFAFPEPAAAALGRLHSYGQWLAAEAASGSPDVSDLDRPGAAGVIAAALERGVTTLDVDEADTVCAAYGVAVPARRAAPADAAAEAANVIGYPVAVKAVRRHIGKSVRAGVALDIADAAAVDDAVAAMRAAIGDDASTVIVQAMTAPGLDLRIRAMADERLGALVTVGLGGFATTHLDDEASRLAPLSNAGAEALIAGSRAAAALDAEGLDDAALTDMVVRVAQLVTDHSDIVEFDLNPIIVSAEGCWPADVTIAVAPHGSVTPPLRRLE